MPLPTFDEIVQDLLEIVPLFPGTLIPVYNEQDTVEIKVQMTYQALRRAIKTKNRVESLVNAYYLGFLFNTTDNSTTEFRLKKKITPHYILIAENAFILFKDNPTQILRTKKLTIAYLRRTHKSKIIELNNQTQECFFVGTQSLEEENCWSEDPQPQ